MFATRGPRHLGRVGSFVLPDRGDLFGYDPDHPENPWAGGTWRPACSYPVRDPAGYVTHGARWFVAIEGGFGWELARPFFQVCARHFGGQHFAGYWG